MDEVDAFGILSRVRHLDFRNTAAQPSSHFDENVTTLTQNTFMTTEKMTWRPPS